MVATYPVETLRGKRERMKDRAGGKLLEKGGVVRGEQSVGPRTVGAEEELSGSAGEKSPGLQKQGKGGGGARAELQQDFSL